MSRAASTRTVTLAQYATEVAFLLHKGGGFPQARAKAVVLQHTVLIKRAWNKGLAPCEPGVALLAVGARPPSRARSKKRGLRLGDAVKSVTTVLRIKQCSACKVRQKKLNDFGAWVTGSRKPRRAKRPLMHKRSRGIR